MTEPPLLLLATGRRPRLRRPELARPKEIELHMAVAHVLRRQARPDWKWAHYPAGEERDAKTSQKLRAMGAKRGWPDFLLFDRSGRLHALELKRRGEGLSCDQEDFQTWCVARGVPHAVAETFDEALKVLSAWGALRMPIGRRA